MTDCANRKISSARAQEQSGNIIPKLDLSRYWAIRFSERIPHRPNKVAVTANTFNVRPAVTPEMYAILNSALPLVPIPPQHSLRTRSLEAGRIWAR